MSITLTRYFEETTVHGFRYVAEGRDVIERLLWIAVISVSFLYAGYLINQSLLDFQFEPVSTSFQKVPIYRVPFPAITFDSGSIRNPFGYIEKILNEVAMDKEGTMQTLFFPLLRKTFQTAYLNLVNDLRSDLEDKILELRTNGWYKVNWSPNRRTRFMADYLDIHNGSEKGYLISLAAAVHQQDPTVSPRVFERLERSAILALRFGATPNLTGHRLAPLDSRALVHDVHAVLEDNAFVLDPDTLALCESSSEACSQALLESASVICALAAITARPSNGWNSEEYYTRLGSLVARFSDKVLDSVFLKKFKYEAKNNYSLLALLRDKRWCEPYDTLSEENGDKRARNPCGDYPGFKLRKHAIEAEDLYLHKILKDMNGEVFGDLLGGINASAYELVQLLDMPFGDQVQLPYQAPFVQEQVNCTHRNYFGGPSCHNSSIEEQERMKIRGCCQLRQKLSQNHEALLKIMKWSIQAPEYGLPKQEYEHDILQSFPFDLTPANKSDIFTLVNYNPRIFFASENNAADEDAYPNYFNLFFRGLTSEGIGYTYNAMPFKDVYKQENPFAKMFLKIMNPQPDKIGNYTCNINHAYKSGPDTTFKVLIQHSEYKDYFRSITSNIHGKLDDKFKLSLHSPADIPNLRNNYLTLKPGFEYFILITPTATSSDENIRQINPERRQCYFADEFNSTVLFKNYTETACMFECRLKHAYKACGCIPWNYPHFIEQATGKLTDLCDYVGNYCFERKVGEFLDKIGDCSCYSDCNALHYSVSISSQKLLTTEHCDIKYPALNTYTNVLYSSQLNNRFSFFGNQFESYMTNQTDNGRDDSTFCKQKISNSALVNFQLATDEVTVIRKSAKLTFNGALANLGGLIGLFTGMSVLSVFEIVFWILRALRGSLP